MKVQRFLIGFAALVCLGALHGVAQFCLDSSRTWRAQEFRSKAQEFHHQGNDEKALRAYRCALQVDPGAVEVYLEMAEIYSLRGRWLKAEECFDEALRTYPTEARIQLAVHRQRALLFWRSGQLSRARAEIDRALAYDAQDALARRLRRRMTLEKKIPSPSIPFP